MQVFPRCGNEGGVWGKARREKEMSEVGKAQYLQQQNKFQD
jgi:hypothetical protein